MNSDLTILLTNTWQFIIPTLDQHIVLDQGYYLEAAKRYSIVVVDDETNKQERSLQTILETAFVHRCVTSFDDLIGLFLHVASHERCEVLWKYCPTLKQHFTAEQLDVIEEAYVQRLVDVVAPAHYSTYETLTARYDDYKGFTVAKRRPLQTMFGRRSDTGIDALNHVHAWLYQSDPLSQTVFNQYMHVCSVLTSVPAISTLIEEYDRP